MCAVHGVPCLSSPVACPVVAVFLAALRIAHADKSVHTVIAEACDARQCLFRDAVRIAVVGVGIVHERAWLREAVRVSHEGKCSLHSFHSGYDRPLAGDVPVRIIAVFRHEGAADLQTLYGPVRVVAVLCQALSAVRDLLEEVAAVIAVSGALSGDVRHPGAVAVEVVLVGQERPSARGFFRETSLRIIPVIVAHAASDGVPQFSVRVVAEALRDAPGAVRRDRGPSRQASVHVVGVARRVPVPAHACRQPVLHVILVMLRPSSRVRASLCIRRTGEVPHVVIRIDGLVTDPLMSLTYASVLQI